MKESCANLGKKGLKQSEEQGMLDRLRNSKEARVVEIDMWEVSQGGIWRSDHPMPCGLLFICCYKANHAKT